jgi:hypothetical protein
MHFDHEALPGGLHRFMFPSTTRRPLKHSLLLDLTAPPGSPERLQCSCDAAAFNLLCKHRRWVLNEFAHPNFPEASP